MKAALKFDLTDEDDRQEFELIQKSHAMFGALGDIESFVISRLKYEEISETERRSLERIRELVGDHAVLS